MKAYVIMITNNHSSSILKKVFKNRDKAIKALYRIKDDFNKDGDSVHSLFKHTPFEVNENDGTVYCYASYYNYSDVKKYGCILTVAQIQECEFDEGE